MNHSEIICRIDSPKCGYPYVDLKHYGSSLLYPDGKLRREVKVWLRDNAGERALRWDEFVENDHKHWVVFEGYDEKLTELQEMQMNAMTHMAWWQEHMRLFFYFKDANMMLMFKLAWGGTF